MTKGSNHDMTSARLPAVAFEQYYLACDLSDDSERCHSSMLMWLYICGIQNDDIYDLLAVA